MNPDRVNPSAADAASATESRELLQRARAGDRDAADRLFARYLPELRRWAHGLMPQWARRGDDTVDIVQDAALHTFRRLSAFESENDHVLRRYLWRALQNRVRDQLRQAARRPMAVELQEEMRSLDQSPFEAAVNKQNRQRYLLGLKRLRSHERTAIVARLELGYSYEQLAIVLHRPTAEAARLAVRRALLHLAREIEDA